MNTTPPYSLLWTLCTPHRRISSTLPLSTPLTKPHSLCFKPLDSTPCQLYQSSYKEQKTNPKE